MIPFSRAELIGVVSQRRPVQTPILDNHFSNTRNLGSRTVQLDIKMSPEGLAEAISPGAESNRASRAGWETMTLTIPRFSEHDLLKAADIQDLRQPGTRNQQIPLMQAINDTMDPIISRFDRTREYMAIKAMQGQIEDGAGNIIATYGVPSATDVTFKSDGTGDNPIDVFDDEAVAIAQELGSEPGGLIAYCGPGAYKALRNESKVLDLLNGPQGPQMLEGGEVRRIGGVTIRRLPSVFVNNQGVEQTFVPDNEIIIASNAMGGTELFGPCETPEGMRMMNRYVDTWEERDPAGQRFRVETNPLPLVRRPASIRRLNVTNA